MKADQILMRFALRFAKIALFFCLQLGSALAGNEHEHLQYLPRYEDIQHATNGNLGSFQAKDVFSNDARGFKSKFGDELFTESEWLQMRERDNLEEFCEKVSKKLGNRTSDEVMKSLFQVQSWHADAKGSYQASGTWRGNLFEKSHKTLERSIESYLSVTRRWQNNKTIFSVPRELIEKKLLLNIKRMFESERLQVQFLYSVPRNFLQQKEFKMQPTLDVIEKGAQEGWLHGVDISGSIREDQIIPNDKKHDIKLE